MDEIARFRRTRDALDRARRGLRRPWHYRLRWWL